MGRARKYGVTSRVLRDNVPCFEGPILSPLGRGGGWNLTVTWRNTVSR